MKFNKKKIKKKKLDLFRIKLRMIIHNQYGSRRIGVPSYSKEEWKELMKPKQGELPF